MDIDLSDEEQPLFKQNNNHELINPDQREQSDSEDDFGLSSMADRDQLDDLNIPSHMKDILRLTSYDPSLSRSFIDDSESDDDSVLGQARQQANRVDIDKLNKELELSRNKFRDFGEEKEEEQPEKAKVKRQKKPKEKKRKRDRKRLNDKDEDILEVAARQRRANRSALDEPSDDSEEEGKRRKKDKKSAGRKTRKKNRGPLVDENGEALIYQTTGLLEDSSSSSEDEKRLSKKEELEMHRENERLRRAAEQRIKPVYNIKTFDDLINRPARKRLETITQSHTLPKVKKEQVKSDSDSDLEITNDPRKIAASLLSPERARYPIPSWSPVRPVTASMREHNRRMLSRMTNESYQHRIKMEQAAKAKGRYTTATERAKQLLQREKDTIMINQQIDQHFEKNNNRLNKDTDDEEEDEDYQEEEDEEEALSGSEDEMLVESLDDQVPDDKNQVNIKDDESDEDSMASMAFRRWKNKKIKKSIFEEDEDEEDEGQDVQPKKKPAPAHSIANFFKSKQTESEKIPEKDAIEEKPLSRLVRRNSLEQEMDEMDVDEVETTHQKASKLETKTSTKPKQKNDYLEEEAVESEDEFFGAAGSDDEGEENLDEFEKDDLVVEHNDENVDEEALREAFNKHDQESDSHMIQRLLTDITGGGLRKQKAAAEAGFMLDDVDIYEDMDNDLIAIRRAAAARRRRLLKAKGGDQMENLLSDPKTAAFAKAAQVVSDEVVGGFLDEEEAADSSEEKEEQSKPEEILPVKSYAKRVIAAEEEDEEDEDVDMEASDDDNVLVVEEYNNPMIMASPMRLGGLTMMEEEEGFLIETMKSPLDVKKAKSIFNSPSNTERFRRLIAETSSALNGNGSDSMGVRIGFGSVQREGSSTSSQSKDKQAKPMGSIGELFMNDAASKEERVKKSKLKNLKKSNLFE